MTDNAVNDRYTIPLLKQVDFRVQNRQPRIDLRPDGGNPTITENSVILHESNGDDYVYSNESYSGNTKGVVFECNVPVIPEGDSSAVYFGTQYYGGEIYYASGYQIYFWGNSGETNNYSYNENDLFRMYIDTNTVYFSINGNIIDSLPYNHSDDHYAEIGFDGIGSNPDNIYTLSNILFYQTGRIGMNGVNGNNSNSLLSGSGNPFPTLGNEGDIYNDVLTNTVWANNGSWSPQGPPSLPGAIVSLAAGSHTVDIWNFVGNSFNSLLITIAFAQDSTTRIPVNLVQVAVNKDNGADGPRWSHNGTFPDGVTINTGYSPNPNPTFNGVRIASTGTSIAYNYITYKIQIIN